MAKYDKDAILKLYAEGKSPSEIEAQLGTTRLVIGQVIARANAPGKANKGEQTKPAQTVATPKEKTNVADNAPRPKKAKRLDAKGWSAIWSLLFGIVAMRLGRGWALTADEAMQLGEATAESFASLPEPVVTAIAQVSAPAMLFGTLATIIGARLDKAKAQLNTTPTNDDPPARTASRHAPPPPPKGNVIDLGERINPEDELDDTGTRSGGLHAGATLRPPSRRNGGDTGAVFGIQ